MQCYNCAKSVKKICWDCDIDYGRRSVPTPFCNECLTLVHSHLNRKPHRPELCQELQSIMSIADLDLLCVICIETSHYVCFTKQESRWIFFDSMANRVCKCVCLSVCVDFTVCTGEMFSALISQLLLARFAC